MLHKSALPIQITRAHVATLPEAVEMALTIAPDHTAVVVLEMRLHGTECWNVAILPHEDYKHFVALLERDLPALDPNGKWTIHVWEQHIDKAPVSAALN